MIVNSSFLMVNDGASGGDENKSSFDNRRKREMTKEKEGGRWKGWGEGIRR